MAKYRPFELIAAAFMSILLVGCSAGVTSQVDIKPLSNSQIDNKVDEIYNLMTIEERVAQLHGIRPAHLTIDGKLSLELCDSLIPNGVGHISQFACMQDLAPDELRDFVADLQEYVIGSTELGIPAIFHEEAITGFSTKGATTYPQQIGVACSWNPQLVEQKSRYTRESMRSVGAQFALSPMVDVIRSQHFNRGEESYGEDGYLASSYAVPFVNGLQGRDWTSGVMATTKHFLGYGGGVELPEKEVMEEILLPHEVAIRMASSKSIMPGYHSFGGESAITNTYFLQDILQKYMNFDGIVVSDYSAMAKKALAKGNPNHFKERAEAAFNAGAMLELCDPICVYHLPELVVEGRVSEECFEHAVKQNLRVKARLGLLDKNPKLYDKGTIELNKPEYDQLAYQLAAQSVVLLKNNGVLPIAPDTRNVALLGPNANTHWAMLGDYTYQALHAFFQSDKIDSNNPKIYTLKEGMESARESYTHLNYERGIDWDSSIKVKTESGGDTRIEASKLDKLVMMLRDEADPTNLQRAMNLARNSDIVVAAVGENAALCGEGRSRKGIRLPGKQEQFVEELIETGKPVVVVIFGGRAQVLSKKIIEGAAAIVQAWYPGQQGGNAVADILFGKVNPSGKLCTSYPATESRKPLCYNYGEQAMEGLVQYPFGYGLSYTEFQYSELKATPQVEIGSDNLIHVNFELRNVGQMAGAEVVQLYISPKGDNPNFKPIQLKGYKRVELAPAHSANVHFELAPELFAYYDCVRKLWVTAPAEFEIKIGRSSADIALSADVTLSGREQVKPLRDIYFSQSN